MPWTGLSPLAPAENKALCPKSRRRPRLPLQPAPRCPARPGIPGRGRWHGGAGAGRDASLPRRGYLFEDCHSRPVMLPLV